MNMVGLFKKSPKEKNPSEAEAVELGRQLFREWREEINQECATQLLFVQDVVDDDWASAEQTGDLQTVINRYCGAIDGTDETARIMFKRFEDRAAELQLNVLVDYTQLRKLQHLLRLRTFFEYKLKMNLVPAGEEREKIRKLAAGFINLEFSDQL